MRSWCADLLALAVALGPLCVAAGCSAESTTYETGIALTPRQGGSICISADAGASADPGGSVNALVLDLYRVDAQPETPLNACRQCFVQHPSGAPACTLIARECRCSHDAIRPEVPPLLSALSGIHFDADIDSSASYCLRLVGLVEQTADTGCSCDDGWLEKGTQLLNGRFCGHSGYVSTTTAGTDVPIDQWACHPPPQAGQPLPLSDAYNDCLGVH